MVRLMYQRDADRTIIDFPGSSSSGLPEQGCGDQQATMNQATGQPCSVISPTRSAWNHRAAIAPAQELYRLFERVGVHRRLRCLWCFHSSFFATVHSCQNPMLRYSPASSRNRSQTPATKILFNPSLKVSLCILSQCIPRWEFLWAVLS